MAGSQTTLLLTEELLLLALRDRKGTMHGMTNWKLALGGAVLAELLLQERLRVVSEGRKGKKKMIEVASAMRVGDEVMDEALARVADAGRRAQAVMWVQRFSRLKKLRDRVARSLCRKGVLRADEDTVLFIFTRKIYPERNPEPERALVARMRDAIFSEGDVDARTAVAVSLAWRSDLLKTSFTRKDLKPRKKRLEAIAEGQVASEATKAAIEAMHAAAAAATTVAVTGG